MKCWYQRGLPLGQITHNWIWMLKLELCIAHYIQLNKPMYTIQHGNVKSTKRNQFISLNCLSYILRISCEFPESYDDREWLFRAQSAVSTNVFQPICHALVRNGWNLTRPFKLNARPAWHWTKSCKCYVRPGRNHARTYEPNNLIQTTDARSRSRVLLTNGRS